ncbi:MAG: ATP-binding cassette domain-containing protein, partial [Promethearchaeota archaeon]
MTYTSIPIINLSGIVKNFKVGKEVINLYENLNFQCEEKDFIVFSGASGSGKSTILSIIAGLTRVDQGTVRILDHNLKDFDEETLAIFRSANMGIVFQMGHLIDTLTILENILLPVELA